MITCDLALTGVAIVRLRVDRLLIDLEKKVVIPVFADGRSYSNTPEIGSIDALQARLRVGRVFGNVTRHDGSRRSKDRVGHSDTGGLQDVLC